MQAFYDERLTNDPEFINERFYALAVQQGVPKSKVQIIPARDPKQCENKN